MILLKNPEKRERLLLRICFTFLILAVALMIAGVIFKIATLLYISIILIGFTFPLNALRPSERDLYYYEQSKLDKNKESI